MRAHVVGNRFQMEAGPACPITQCRAIQVNALAGVDLGLPVERQVIAELRYDDLSDQRLGWQATGHHMFGCMRLRYGLRTAAAGVFRTTRHQHAQLRRDHVQPLAHVLTDLRHLAAAAWAQRALRLDNPFHPWQMRRKLTAIAVGRTSRTVGFAFDDRRRFLLGGIEHALGDLHVFQRQMILIRPQLLGFRSELLPAHVDEDTLQPPPSLLRHGKRRLRLRQLPLQALVLIAEDSDIHVLFKHVPCLCAMRRAKPESLCRSDNFYPASCGRRLPSGRTRRQSNPSNKAANMAGDIRITPSRTCGQTNLQPSSRLCTSTSPVRSQTKIFTRSARFARNTKAAPLNGSSPNICCTNAASPS